MAKKRGNSEGSIYEDADGRWRASVHIGWANGKRVRKLLSGMTRAAVAQKLTEAMRNQQLGIAPASERQTVSQYLKHWLDHVAAKQVRPKTLRTYSDIVEQHLIPALGTVPLQKLSVQKVREFMSGKSVQPMEADAPGTFSARTVKHMRDTLRAALNVAMRDGLILRNPAALAIPPREATQHEPMVLGPDEARGFVKAIEGTRFEALFSVALALGLREGEILGLRWQDVDLERGTLTVRFQLQRIAKKLTLTEPKTKRSCRTIALPAIAVKALRAHQMRQEGDKQFAGARWRETGMVFTTSIGTMLDARNMLRDFYRITRKANSGLERLRFHDLRHSAATLLLMQGAHLAL
jgi:integrase